MDNFSGIPIRDIHLPEPVSWWPPAPGWWLLISILIVGIAITGLLRYRLKKIRMRKAALQQLADMIQVYQTRGDALGFVRELSKFLRVVSLHHYQAEHSASISGDKWLRFLDRQLPNNMLLRGDSFTHKGSLLVSAPYRQDMVVSDEQVQQLVVLSRKWLQNLPLSGALVAVTDEQGL